MRTETTGRTPQGTAAEPASMRAVDDWPSVWSGPRRGGSAEFDERCGRYGWEPQTFDRQLHRTRWRRCRPVAPRAPARTREQPDARGRAQVPGHRAVPHNHLMKDSQ